ncbi:CU044_2847 family protein [Deinococcus oregonensis]|uniref:CU044_2847 family protein n=1 Tax=Deinococcus oregonensis TaxID=1805970 RepID=A0ABV6AX15_9DEIO
MPSLRLIASSSPAFAEYLEQLRRSQLVPDASPAAIQRRINAVADTGNRPTKRQLEAQIRGSDALDVNYLQLGQRASHPVCRVDLAPTAKQPLGGTATGFLVGPGLLLTNHHVLRDPEDAQRAEALFQYEYDVTGRPLTPVRVELDPAAGFWTDQTLDFSLVALQPTAQDGLPSDRFGFLRLNPNRGKTDQGLYVTVIGHPGGHHKQISLRENRVLVVGEGPANVPQPEMPEADTRLWYEADTLPGSSGSPVFNDLFQVVALHSAGVPQRRMGPDGGVQLLLADADPENDDAWVSEAVAEKLPTEALSWIANEGVRVSNLVQRLREVSASETAPGPRAILERWLDDLSQIQAFSGTVPKGPVVAAGALQERARAAARPPRVYVRPLEYYANAQGYDPGFLPVPVPLPTLTGAVARFGPAARLIGGGTELRYTHFSVVMSERRRLAFFTAVNIDGARLQDVPRDDRWYFDSRLDLQLQVGDELYSNEPGAKGYFDRGHLVRRRDPVWGPDAARANEDTFHWTNCAPQYWDFNQSDAWWQGLEEYILLTTDQDDLRASVFTGPVFAEDDELHRGVAVPQGFWKVMVVCDDAGQLTSSAYLVSQAKYAKNIPFELQPSARVASFQISVTELEERTGLDFGPVVRAADLFEPPAPGGSARLLRGLADVRHSRRKRPVHAPQPEVRRELVADNNRPWTVPSSVRGVLIEVDAPPAQSLGAENLVTRVAPDFQAALYQAKPVLEAVANFLQELNHPNEASIQLGLKLTAGADVILAKLSTEGSLSVTLKWSKPS